MIKEKMEQIVKNNEKKLQKEIEQLMNKYNVDIQTDTPDFILAEYLMSNLRIYLVTKSDTEKWFGKRITINGIEEIESKGDKDE